MANYSYSIANDTANGELNSSLLHEEIKADSGLESAFIGIQTSEDNIICVFTGELTAGLITSLTTIISTHTGGNVDADPEVDEAPDNNTGSQQGYQPGSIVVHDNTAYVLLNNTAGAAVWQAIGNDNRIYHYNEMYQGFTHTSDNWVNVHSWTTPTLPAGRYRIGWSYLWSSDSTSYNFEAQILVGSTRVHLHQEEPQDSYGYDKPVTSNAGCDQAMPGSGFVFIDLVTGAHTIVLQTRAEDDDEQVTIHRNVFEIERVGDATAIDPSQNLIDREEY